METLTKQKSKVEELQDLFTQQLDISMKLNDRLNMSKLSINLLKQQVEELQAEVKILREQIKTQPINNEEVLTIMKEVKEILNKKA